MHWWKLSTLCMIVGLDHRPSSFKLMMLASVSNFYFFLCLQHCFHYTMESRLKPCKTLGWFVGYGSKIGGPIRTILLHKSWAFQKSFASSCFLLWKPWHLVMPTQLECTLLVVQFSVLSMAYKNPHPALDILI